MIDDGGGYLRLNCLRVLQGAHTAYEENFHGGVNIIRGQNGSGKSTIADFIFYILGGEYDDWKDAASCCDEVQAEIETSRGSLTLKRKIGNSQEPMFVFFGTMKDALESSVERWERFPIRRKPNRESFSQVLFRSMRFPEAKSEGAANITMHQLLRLCYSDQRTPAPRLFRFEQFDTHRIREAVGDLICGVSDFELYEVGLELRDAEKGLEDIKSQLKALQSALPNDEDSDLLDQIKTKIESLRSEAKGLRVEIDQVEELVEHREVKDYLLERKDEQTRLIKEREEIAKLETSEQLLGYELSEIEDFVSYLNELTEKVGFAEATFEAIGSIDFTQCPACGEQLDTHTPATYCVLCKSPIDTAKDSARYNQIRLDLEIQIRESRQLIDQKLLERREKKKTLIRYRRDHEKRLTTFNLKYTGANGPRDSFLAARINRVGYIDAEIDYLQKRLEIAEQISELVVAKNAHDTMIKSLKTREKVFREHSEKRRNQALKQLSELASSIIRSDLNRQEGFAGAGSVKVDFQSDSISVDGSVNFAESSNVYLKNAAILGLFLAAANDEKFFHPRFILIDNIEDKGMEVERTHLFQRILVESVTKLDHQYQAIYTTSMMNPELELDDYTIGPVLTSRNRSLKLLS